jgi:hypothetical protein
MNKLFDRSKITDIKKFNVIQCEYLRLFEDDHQQTIDYLSKLGMFGFYSSKTDKDLKGSSFLIELKERSMILHKLAQNGLINDINNSWYIVKVSEQGVTLYAGDINRGEDFIVIPWNSVTLFYKADQVTNAEI